MAITFLGDVYLPQPYSTTLNLDCFVFNLEYPITNSQIGYPNKVNIKAEHEYITETFSKTPIAVNTANNHILDFRKEGLEDTLKLLEETGIDHFGAGLEEQSFNPAVFQHDGKQIGLFGYISKDLANTDYAHGQSEVAVGTIDQIESDISKVDSIDRIVVQIHWGEEDVHFPSTKQIQLGREIAELDVDLVIGHHSHCIQPSEIYNGTPIYYGIGNCIMPDLSSPSYYEDGAATKHFEKVQHWWNRRSIGVRYDPIDNTVTTISLEFDGTLTNRRELLRSRLRNKVFNHAQDSQLQGIHGLSYKYGVLRKDLMNYYANPTMVTPSSFIRLYKRMLEK